MNKGKRKDALRESRHRRVRRKVHGTAERPRLCVFRSNKHIYAQVTDDWRQHTVLSCSSLSPELKGQVKHGGSVECAVKVGELIGRKCLEAGITALVFDRGGYRYHGRVKALAEAARAPFAEAGAPGF
jgi:large subunit ribosomal protein L18